MIHGSNDDLSVPLRKVKNHYVKELESNIEGNLPKFTTPRISTKHENFILKNMLPSYPSTKAYYKSTSLTSHDVKSLRKKVGTLTTPRRKYSDGKVTTSRFKHKNPMRDRLVHKNESKKLVEDIISAMMNEIDEKNLNISIGVRKDFNVMTSAKVAKPWNAMLNNVLQSFHNNTKTKEFY